MTFPVVPYIAFAFAASVTPGPNNVMISACAANYGIRRTVPMIAGVMLGIGSMLLIGGIGLAAPLALYPGLQRGMRWVGLAWMLFLSWKIATSALPGEGPARPPLGVLGAALFQWINPKAWMISLAIATTWTQPDSPVVPQVLLTTALFCAVGTPSSFIWACIGAGAARVLHSAARLRMFNVVMAVLLAASVLPLALQD